MFANPRRRYIRHIKGFLSKKQIKMYNLHGECSLPFFDSKVDIPVEQYRYEENRTIYNHLVDRISKQLSTDKYIVRTYEQKSGFAGDQMDVYFIFSLSHFPQGSDEAIRELSKSGELVQIGDNVLYKQTNYGILKDLEFGICNFLMHDNKEEIERRLNEELARIDNINFKEIYGIMLQKAVESVQQRMDTISQRKKRFETLLNKAKASNEYAYAGDEKYGFVDRGSHLEMTVPKPLMPHLIGSGGNAIKRVQSLLGKRIKLIPVDAPCYTKRCGWII